MDSTLTFVTRNARKFEEALLILDGIDLRQKQTELVEIQGDPESIIRHKIQEARLVAEPPFFVDDTFLHFNALKGLPGPYINDFSTKLGPEGLYRMLADFADKRAEAVSLIGYQGVDAEPVIVEGRIQGTIVAPRGTTVFGWDPIFLPDGSAQTFAEMGIEGKSHISHRRKALEQLRERLK